MANRLRSEPQHTKDSDCTKIDPRTSCCTECGAGHGGDPCLDCGQVAYHLPRCPEMVAAHWLEKRDVLPLLPLLGDACACGATLLAIAHQGGAAGPGLAREALEQLRQAQARRL